MRKSDLRRLDPARIVVLTGAGISAESGVPTFRGSDGLWEGYRIDQVATPQAFARNPELVQRFYDLRRGALDTVEPNAAHLALGRLDREWRGEGREFLIVTQNVDDLHERGGAERVLHMHGQLRRALCTACGARFPSPTVLSPTVRCPECDAGGARPDIVWFGEMPYHMPEIAAALSRVELFLSVGTSGSVHPAANFVDRARAVGALCLELNLDPSMASDRFDESILGPASELVPRFVEILLEGEA